jgi:aryl-alcohol dehydrogenase-like predicted oxidoreductase
MLTGKFTPDTTFPKDDFRHHSPMFQGEHFRQYLSAVDELKKLAGERGKTVTQLAVRWALQQNGVSVALWGARRPEQLKDADGVLGWELTAEDLARIDRILREKVTNPVPSEESFGPPSRSQLQNR